MRCQFSFCLLVLAGCSVPMMYQESVRLEFGNGPGYSDRRVAENRFHVRVTGYRHNSNYPLLDEFLRRRAGELCTPQSFQIENLFNHALIQYHPKASDLASEADVICMPHS